jgi:uncharacterized protein
MTAREPAARQSASLPALVEAMMRPAFYPEPPDRVELVQTHISYVFIAGAFVYKLKKAVCFSFIDCTDLKQRRHFCAEEIRLNRRLAPDMYCGMFPIVRHGNEFALGEQATEHPAAVDYVLKMRRLPVESMLDHMVSQGGADPATITTLATVLVNFYRNAPSAKAAKYASAAEVWRLVIGEILELERLVGATLSLSEFAPIENYCRTFITSHWKMLNSRVAAGRVREGHGDLRAEHISIENGKISIFDCVEFSEKLRTCDIASEVGFLAMDLDRLGARDLADTLVAAIEESTQDHDLPTLLPFYKCYRAIIRGVVESLRSRQTGIEAGERVAATTRAAQYFSLARGYATAAAPAVIVVCGLSGTGKSTLARALQSRSGFAIISSDRTRKRLAAIPVQRSAADSYKSGIYTDAVTEATYTAMLDEAAQMLRDGTGVIFDGTFQDPAQRKAVLELAEQVKLPILFVECRAEDDEIRRRLIERERAGQDPSDATVEVYLRQREDFVALSEIAAGKHLTVDTSRGSGELVDAVKNAMEKLSR